MTSPVQQLLALMDADDPFDYRIEDVRGLQLEAANERFAVARQTMPLVDARATDGSVEKIESLGDVIPLFFSDKTYKSYPESLVTDGKWRTLGTWLDTLSTDSGAADVDATGVRDIDDWLARLRKAGHKAYVSSGTSGRCSIFKVNDVDQVLDRKVWQLSLKWATGALPDQSRAVFALLPSQGMHRMMDSFGQMVRDFGRADASYYLSDEPLRVSGVNALGRLRHEVAVGTAAPSRVRQVEQDAAGRAAKMSEALDRLAEAVIKHQGEPSFFLGTWAPQYLLASAARARGFTEGAHPNSLVFAGGGLKGVEVPGDYREQIETILALDPSRYFRVYGVSELTTFMPACSAMRYHCAPWQIPIVLDKLGEQLVEPEGARCTGRMAFFDLCLDGRWGALITGDRATLCYDRCPCGRSSPTVLDTVVRYSDLPDGDDRVMCSGTIDAYVRGLLGSAEE